MEIIVTVPTDRVEFALEVLRNLAFVESARPRRAAKAKPKPAASDTTSYLLASPANAAHLARSIAQLKRGEGIAVDLPE